MSGSHIDLCVDYDATRIQASIQWTEPVLALFGPSGSGKSTVLEAVAGLRPEASGTVRIGDKTFQSDGESPPLASHRRNVGWAPQEASLFPHLTVKENMLFGARDSGRERLEEAAHALGLTALLERGVEGLSGGERQRVALARAILRRPALLLLDEPFAPLDRALREQVLNFLCALRDRDGMRMIVVSHDMAAIRALAGHVAVLNAGSVVLEGHPDTVFTAGEALSVAVRIGCENRFAAMRSEHGDGRRARTLGGTPLVVAEPIDQPDVVVTLGVRAEDVMLAVQEPVGLSARNCIPGRVLGIHVDEDVAYVRVATHSDEWVARLSLDAVKTLQINDEMALWVVVKASAIHAQLD